MICCDCGKDIIELAGLVRCFVPVRCFECLPGTKELRRQLEDAAIINDACCASLRAKLDAANRQVAMMREAMMGAAEILGKAERELNLESAILQKNADALNDTELSIRAGHMMIAAGALRRLAQVQSAALSASSESWLNEKLAGVWRGALEYIRGLYLAAEIPSKRMESLANLIQMEGVRRFGEAAALRSKAGGKEGEEPK